MEENSGKTCKGSLRADDTCDFCGGLNPKTILQLIRDEQCSITPTDKNYKIYVDTFNGRKKAYFEDFTTEQQDEFIRLYNEKTMKINYPGYFYVLPYFAKTK